MRSSSSDFELLGFLPENLWRLLVNELVRQAVTGDLVPRAMQFLDEAWDAFRDPAEDEERRAHAVAVEQLEQHMRVALDARLLR